MDGEIYSQIETAANHLRQIAKPPRVSVVLGSGLGAFAETLDDKTVVLLALQGL